MKAYLLQPISRSWLIAALAAGVLPGAYVSSVVLVTVAPIEWYAAAGVLGALLFMRQHRYLLFLALVAGFCLGMARGYTVEQQIAAYERYAGKQVLITGKIGSDPSIGIKGDERYVLQVATVNNQPMDGNIWVSFSESHQLRRGDVVVVSGQLRDGFGTNLASMYRTELVARDMIRNDDRARQVRDIFSAYIHQVMPPDEAGLALGFLVGQKQTFSESIADQFQVVGLTHAVVASGFHLTVLVMFVRRILEKVSKYLTLLAAGTMVAGFTAITGLSPSMTRAAIIATLALWAWYYGRNFHPGVLLTIVAGASTLWNPLYVQGDIGWYLSFAAFVGVIMLAPLLHAYFWGERTPGILRTLVMGTLAAQIATLPLLLYVFGAYSPYALVANLLVVPLVTIVMALTFITGILTIISVGLGGMLAIPLVWILGYMIDVVGWIATLPYAQQELTLSLLGVYVLYGVLIMLMWFMQKRSRHNFQKQWQII